MADVISGSLLAETSLYQACSFSLAVSLVSFLFLKIARSLHTRELDTVLRPCVEEYARNLEITTDEAYALLKKNYDGYHFARKSQDVYVPFSVLRAFDGRNTDHYWFESGTMTSLREHLRHYPLKTALQYDGVKVGLDEFNISCESASTPIPLLYQSGYLTIDSYEPLLKTYTLHFPNLEVRSGRVVDDENNIVDEQVFGQ